MLMIRLRRMGGRNRPYYRVIVSDSRQAPTASAVEELGSYDPHTNPPQVRVDHDRMAHWVQLGAHLSPTVKKLFAGGTPAPVSNPVSAPAASPASS